MTAFCNLSQLPQLRELTSCLHATVLSTDANAFHSSPSLPTPLAPSKTPLALLFLAQALATAATGECFDALSPPLVLTPSHLHSYTTKDGNAAMVRAQLGAPYNGVTWFFVPRSCLSSQLAQHTLNNEDD